MQEQHINVNVNDVESIKDLADRPLDTAHVEALVADGEPNKWPPIIVTSLGNGKYGRIAGKHRLAAAKELKVTTLKATVRQYNTWLEMTIDAWEDNVRNGKPLSRNERNRFALWLHEAHPDMPYREIGRRAGLHHTTVSTLIEGSQEQEEEEDGNQASYNQAMIDYAKRLLTSLQSFYENENAFFGGAQGQRSEAQRAKALAKKLEATEANVAIMHSLSRSLEQTAAILKDKMQKSTAKPA